jgi:translation initiation factor IF-2
MRINELAKEVGLSSADLMARMREMGMEARNHAQTVASDEVRAIKVHLAKAREQTDVAPTKAPKKAAAPAEESTSHSTAVGKKKKTSPFPPVVVAPPPAPEKKKTLLIKKKIDLPPVVAPPEEILSPPDEAPSAEDEAPSAPEMPLAPLPVPPASVGIPTEAIPTTPTMSPSVTPKSRLFATPQIIRRAEMPVEEPLKVVSMLPVAKPAAEKEKKKGKAEKTTATPTTPTKEKPKKWRMSEWVSPDSEPDATAAVSPDGTPVESPGAGVAPSPQAHEARQWKEFKPIHGRDDKRGGKKGRGRMAFTPIEAAKPRRKDVKIYQGITVKELSELLGLKVQAIIGKLMEIGKMATINQPIDLEEASLIAESFGIKAEAVADKTEDEILNVSVAEDPALRMARPPVVTIMGHVDHGKTSLLDAIRKTKVTEGEAGGITQHIGAYTIAHGEKSITFLDTPGHEAFTAMRARGAKITDIVVLVVAADDGVMPQTVEAIHHAQAAGVPIVVAVNKIDKPEANIDRVKGALGDHALIPEEWGGKTIFAEVSAKQNIGLSHFIEMLLLQAEVMELTANPSRPMRGTLIEAKLDRSRGPVATVLVQDGTLKVGDAFVTGTSYGRVRAMFDDEGHKVDQAGPSSPVAVIGLNSVPDAGDSFVVVDDERTAKEVANGRMQRRRLSALASDKKMTLADLHSVLQQGKTKGLKVILKADVHGSAEAVKGSIEKLSSDIVQVNVLHVGVGGITESDVLLASASGAIVIGFNVRPDPTGRKVAEREQVDVRLYTIIYEVVADLRKAMEGLLDPTFKERVLGRVEVRQVFTITKVGTVIGGYVSDGVATRTSSGIRVLRDSVVVYEGKLSSLRRFKDDVREVATGYECGLSIENFNDVKVGDVVEIYIMDKISGVLPS